MIKKNLLTLLLTLSLTANAMVMVTWIITNALGYDMLHPDYLFKNVAAGVAIAGVSTVLGWFYSRKTNLLLMGSIHFLVTASVFVFVGLWANWFPANAGILLTGMLIFIIIFLSIWFAHYLYWKVQIKKINSKLG